MHRRGIGPLRVASRAPAALHGHRLGGLLRRALIATGREVIIMRPCVFSIENPQGNAQGAAQMNAPPMVRCAAGDAERAEPHHAGHRSRGP